MSFTFSVEQIGRLRELGVDEVFLDREFTDAIKRNQAYQKEEKRLVLLARKKLDDYFQDDPRPLVEKLIEDLARVLRGRGLAQVSSPIIMSRARIVKMGLESDPLFSEQIFWLDAKRCLRPMLAPHLYEFMLDLVKLRPGPFGLFEIGPCFRKESQGAHHANEFTMLNLVLVGCPLEQRQEKLSEFASLVMATAGIKDWRFESENSTVYGDCLDVVNARGMELASSSMGPHPLDEAWGFTETWVGLGFGLERLAMSIIDTDQMSMVGRSLSRIYGLPLKL